MKRTAVAVTLLLSLVLLAAFATYVWPTRYRYSAGTNSKPRALLVRVDRFSGRASYLSDTGWTNCRKRNIFADLGIPEPVLENPLGLPDPDTMRSLSRNRR